MLSCYSCKRKTNRWPIAVFSNIIDISALNALIIFKEIDPDWQTNQKATIRRNFLRELGLALAKPYMSLRAGKPRTSSSASLLSSVTLQETNEPIPPPSKRSKSVPAQAKGRLRCHICYTEKASTKNNMHETICCFCNKGICKANHSRNVCVECISNKL